MSRIRNEKMGSMIVVAVLCLCSFMGMLLTTARSVILKPLLTQLDGVDYYSVAVIITSMMMAAVLPIAGKLSDIIGRKIILLVGIAGYMTASLICACASRDYVYIIGIVFVGIFYGCMSSVSSALICEYFEEKIRPKYNSCLMVASSAASLIGPVFGGIAVDYVSWRLVYLMIVPIALVAFICGIIFIDNKKNVADDKMQKIPFDYKGTLLLFMSVILLLFSLAAGGKIYSWSSPVIVWCICISLIAFVLLIFVERKAQAPIVPYRLFMNREYRMCLELSFLGWFAFSIMNYVTVFYQDIINVPAAVCGMLVVPRQLAQISISILAGWLLVRYGRYKRYCVVFTLVYVCGMLLMVMFNSYVPIAYIVLAEICFGVGISGQSIVVSSYIQNTLERADYGTGLAFFGFLGSLASSSGASVGGCIINQIKNPELGFKAAFMVYLVMVVISFLISVCGKWIKCRIN